MEKYIIAILLFLIYYYPRLIEKIQERKKPKIKYAKPKKKPKKKTEEKPNFYNDLWEQIK